MSSPSAARSRLTTLARRGRSARAPKRATAWSVLRRLGLTGAALAAAAIAILFLALTAGPKSGLYLTYTVLTQSMEPTIPQGSVVVVAPITPDQLQVGDIITFSSSSPPYATLTHRVISIERDGDAFLLRTKGDANLLVDPWTLKYSQQAGIVRFIVPLAGYVIAAISADQARLALGIAFVGLVAAFWLLTVWGRSRTPEEVPRAAPAQQVGSSRHLSPVRAVILVWLMVGLVTRRRLAS